MAVLWAVVAVVVYGVLPVRAQGMLASAMGGGGIHGSVVDASGAQVAGAVVVLEGPGRTERRLASDAEGNFKFDGVSAGLFEVRVQADGLQPDVESGRIGEGEQVELAPVTLRPGAVIEVNAISPREEMQLEVKAEEKQRLAGFMPNFYVVYDQHPQALTAGRKFHLAMKTIVDPTTPLVVGGVAGMQQAKNMFPGYGQGAAGYGKRFGAGLADLSVGTMLGGAVLPTVFRQDPRYFYKGTGSVRSRVLYALSTAVRSRSDKGKWQPAYASVLGDFGAGAISNLYYPASDRHGAGLTIENGFLSVASDAFNNVVQELLLRRFTPRAMGAAGE